MMTEARTPLHPQIADLLRQMNTRSGDHVSFSPQALVGCRARLLTDLRDDPTAFLHLLVAWARFNEMHIEPASAQLYDLLKLFPQVRQAKNRDELMSQARAAAQVANQSEISRIVSGLSKPKNGVGVGRATGHRGRPAR